MTNFNVSQKECDLVMAIVERWEGIFGHINKLNRSLDIIHIHLNICPLNLQGLLDAEFKDFTHDLEGIFRNVNKSEKDFLKLFRPRFALKQ